MRAGRSQARAEIYSRLGNAATVYPIEAALTDLERYRQAGTLATAIAGITEQAAVRETTSAETADAAAEDFLANARITRVTAPATAATDIALPRIQRLDAIATRIKDPTKVPADKLVTLLTQPPTEDPNFKLRLEEIRDRILSRDGVTEVTTDTILRATRSRIATAVLESSGDKIVTKLEELFPEGG